MTSLQPIVYRRRSRLKIFQTLQAIWRNIWALWRKFQRSIVAFVLVTFVGGFIYGELHIVSGRVPIALIDRPYIMLQLMILETPYDAPSEWYLIIFWYALPAIFVFIVGNGVADFVRLFFDRSGRSDAWREALVSTYRNHVIVLGAGHVGVRVVKILREVDVEVVVIDNEPEANVEAVLTALRVPLIREDGRIPATLEHAGLKDADAFVACTGDDNLNLYAVMRARDMNPDIRIVARVWEDEFAEQIKRFMNVQSVLSSSGLAAPAFAGLALGVEITQSVNVEGMLYSTLRLTVNGGAFLEGRDVGTLQREQDMDIVLLVRDKKVEVQPAHDVIVKTGDILVIFAQHDRCIEIAARNHYRK